MKGFRNNFTSSTSIKPRSEFHGKTEDEKTLDVDSSLPPYDPVTNYILPRPKFLWYNPDRHRQILARQEESTRIFKIAEHESERCVDHSVEDDNGWSLNVFLQDLVVMGAFILIILTLNSPPLSSTESVHVSETQGETSCPMMLMAGYLNDREIDKGYKKRDQNKSTVSTKESVEVQSEQTVEVQHEETGMDFNMYETDEKVSNEWQEPVILTSKKIETYLVEAENEVCIQMLGAAHPNSSYASKESVEVQSEQTVEVQHEETEIDFNKYETDEKVSNEWQEPVILISKKIEIYRVEAENEVYIQMLGAAHPNSSYASKESNILKPMVDEDDSNKSLKENEIEGKENKKKLTYFDPVFAGLSAIAVLIFASTSVLYYSQQTEVSSPIDESSFVGSFGSRSNIFSEYYESSKDASSSNQTKYFDFQQSTGESSVYGSFAIVKNIVKYPRGKRPVAAILTVRRSSRIHNCSISLQ